MQEDMTLGATRTTECMGKHNNRAEEKREAVANTTLGATHTKECSRKQPETGQQKDVAWLVSSK